MLLHIQVLTLAAFLLAALPRVERARLPMTAPTHSTPPETQITGASVPGIVLDGPPLPDRADIGIEPSFVEKRTPSATLRITNVSTGPLDLPLSSDGAEAHRHCAPGILLASHWGYGLAAAIGLPAPVSASDRYGCPAFGGSLAHLLPGDSITITGAIYPIPTGYSQPTYFFTLDQVTYANTPKGTSALRDPLFELRLKPQP